MSGGIASAAARRRLPWRALLLGLVATVVAWLLLPAHGLRVNLEFASVPAGPGEVFYAAADEGFDPGRSVSFGTVAGGAPRGYRVDIAARRAVARLRLDLATAPGAVELRSLEIRGRVLWLKTRRFAIPLQPASVQQVGSVARTAGVLRFQSLGNDPYLEIALPTDVRQALAREAAWLRLLAALAVGCAVLLVRPGLGWARRVARGQGRMAVPMRRVADVFARTARACSDPATIVFSPSGIALIALAACLATAGVAGRINLSSIGIWNGYLPGTGIEDPTLVGSPKAVRADEWLVMTPWMMSQAARGFPIDNRALGGQRSTLLTSVPLAHPVATLQPEFWGFAVFDVERAVSWYWMYKLFGLLVSGFLLLLLLTRGDGFLSACGAVWICFSSYTQWWFSTNLPETLIGLFLTLTGFAYVCMATRRRTLAFGCIALLLGAATFAFQVYPPFQIPLAYLAAAIVAGTFAHRANRARFRERAGIRVLALAGCAGVLGFLLYRFAIDAAGTIQAMSDTAYPGRRFSVGGTMPWWMAFDGLFEGFRVGEARFPYANSNASESSDYVLLFPLVLAAMALRGRAVMRRDGLLLALAAFCTLLAAWMVIALPAAVEDALSRVLLLSFVPPQRATVAAGIASILLATIWMARMRGHAPGKAGAAHWAFVAIATVAAYHYGAALHGVDPGFFGGRRILLGSAAFALGAWAIVRGSRRAFGAFVVVVALPGLAVNPLSRGLGPLLDSPVLASAVAASRDGGHRWIVFGNFVLPQAFKAAGLDVLGGATYLPDAATMAILDPSRRSVDTWNRYAHIQVESDRTLPSAVFELQQADLYRLRLDVCSAAVTALGVDRVAYAGAAPAADLACLRPIGTQVSGVSLYARVVPGA